MKGTFPSIKFVCALLIISLFFSIAMIGIRVQSATTPKLYVDPSKVEYWTPAFGETFMINVSIANVSNLQVFEFRLYWNTTQLDLVKVDIQSFLNPPTQIFNNATDEGSGWYELGIMSRGPAKDGSGAVVTLSFNITYDPTWPENATGAFHLFGTKLYDPDGGLIPHNVDDGEYSCYSSPPLSITLAADKPSYWRCDSVHIYGNLTLGPSPVTDGLVALQVDDAQNQFMVVRTLSTGTPPASQIVEIVDVIPCNKYGNPKNNFYKGLLAYFNVTIKNNDNETRWVLIVLNVYDALNRPFGMKALGVPVAANSTPYHILSIGIPDTVEGGNAQVYASAFTEWPRDGGIAYCPEESATFKIIGSSSAGGTTSSNPEGTFELTFNLPCDARLGNYTVYASSEYTIHEYTQKVTSNMTFEVTPPPWDINGDGCIDMGDVVIVCIAFGSAAEDDPETPWDETANWNPIADIAPLGNPDGCIDMGDVVLPCIHFGEGCPE